jgi:hypothetical protein
MLLRGWPCSCSALNCAALLAVLVRWDIERPGQLEPLPALIPDWEGCSAVPPSPCRSRAKASAEAQKTA